jgi:hypothetical protein
MFKNLNDLKIELHHAISFHDSSLKINKKEHITHELLDKLVYTTVFSTDESLKAKTRRIIHTLALEYGSTSASIRPLYQALGEGKIHGFTVPAMNVRMMTYDTVRAMFRVAKQKKAGALIIEIARTESEYTFQPPDEFVTVVLAAAIREGYSDPIFIQGDHCQFNAKKYTADPHAEIMRIKDWVTLLLDAGFRNIDIDGSTLVDLSKPSLTAQQKDNAFVTAEMTRFIREQERKLQSFKDAKMQREHNFDPDLIGAETLQLWSSATSQVVIGGEIGHIGDTNSTLEDFEAFMHQYLNQVPRGSGISKVSVQTGTSHGGIISADGKVQAMPVDFSVLETIGKVAKEKYQLAGPVQHGASTLPLGVFHKFVNAHTAEIHLSTGFQNIVYDTMPDTLRETMYTWAKKELKDEWTTGWTENQFLYKVRKKTWGPFKKELWNLSETEKRPIIYALEEYLTKIYDELHIEGTIDAVRKYVSL